MTKMYFLTIKLLICKKEQNLSSNEITNSNKVK